MNCDIMRIARLSALSSSAPKLALRTFHIAAPMRTQARPEWLRRIPDNTVPPKLYAWTPGDLLTPSNPTTNKTKPSQPDEARRIYVLGVGNIGRLYAICLSKLPNPPPITLVVHRKDLLTTWLADPGISLTRHGNVHTSADFDIEWWTDEPPPTGREVRTISNLVVATKAPDAIPQVDRVRRYLGTQSTVSFAQNGMCKLWPPLGAAYVRERFPDGTGPNWIACVTMHGVTSLGAFKSVHASPAGVLVGPVLLNGRDEKGMRTLMKDMAAAPDLSAKVVSRRELWVAQLEKLVVNAVINPLTAVLRCRNGELFVDRGDGLGKVIEGLLSEASEVLGALVIESDEILAEGEEGVEKSREVLLERFSFERLRDMVLKAGEKVKDNTSSMLQDVRAGKQTEINDINGWILDTAKFTGKGLQLPTHEKLVALVKAQAELTRGELCQHLL